MRKPNKVFHKNLHMKATIFDESGRKIFKSEGEPKRCIMEIMHFGRFGLSVIDWNDVYESFDWLGLSKEEIKDGRKLE